MSRIRAKGTAMTRKEALDTMGATLDDWIDKKNMHMLIDQIFNDHEAQMKAKDEEIEAKDEALELIIAMCELGLKTQDTYRTIIQKLKAQSCDVERLEEWLKAKDEEIDRLEKVASDLFIEGLLIEAERKKARSIVAMLFWEWKSGIKYIESQYDKGIVEGMRYSFHKAYKILKNTK